MSKNKFFLYRVFLTTSILVVFCFFTPFVNAFDCDVVNEVDINSAPQEELECLSGVGPAYAVRIIEGRPFQSLDDLQNVSGIGPVTVEKIKDQGLATVKTSNEESEEENSETEEGDEEENSETEEQEKAIETVRSYSSSVEISIIEEVSFVKVGAGRDRLVSVESDVVFKAYVEDEGKINRRTDFEWVLGDGSVKKGREINHQYFVPGTYNVVLTVKCGKEEAVSYMEVKVIEPKVSIKEANERFVSLLNSSEGEINLGGWQIESKEEVFLIPENTIVKEGDEIFLPKQVTGIEIQSKDRVKLKSPSGNFDYFYTAEDEKEREGTFFQEELLNETSAVKTENEKLKTELSFLREEIGRMVSNQKIEENKKITTTESLGDNRKEVSVDEKTEKNKEKNQETKKSEEKNVYKTENKESNLTKVIYESDESKKGIWKRLLGAPSYIFEKLPF